MIAHSPRISAFADLEDHSQKLEILGRLAGGVAHDMNNALTVINGFSDLALARLLPSDPCRGLIEEVRKAGEHAADLTRQLLTFSRKQTLSPQLLDLNLVVTEMGTMLRRVITEDIELLTHLQRDLFATWADIGRMEQLLMNLVVNARDAMTRGGRLTITTKNIEQEVWPYFQIMLAISDTGMGMTDEVKSRLFEPFFTTKSKGKGTGLGLATVYEIVQKADGRIEVDSEPGRGTTFRVYLPGIKSPSWPGRSRPDFMRNAPHGKETVLLVEDEYGVRSLCKQVLQKQGYLVLEAECADDATAKCKEVIGPIDILVSDVVMPGFSGHHLAERLLELRPHLRVLFISGYADDEVVERGVVQSSVHFLQKPFTPLALSQKVREVLDAIGV